MLLDVEAGRSSQRIIPGHVVDFFFAGPKNDPEWQALTSRIREHLD